ncbi:hypothetical protein YSY22_17350 [Brevibacillus formosus]
MHNILIVEDELPISRVLKAYLEKNNFRVEQAFNGEEAERKFDSHNPALVLLDVMLPGRSGWSILEREKQHSSNPLTHYDMSECVILPIRGILAVRGVGADGKKRSIFRTMARSDTHCAKDQNKQIALFCQTTRGQDQCCVRLSSC